MAFLWQFKKQSVYRLWKTIRCVVSWAFAVSRLCLFPPVAMDLMSPSHLLCSNYMLIFCLAC